LFDGGRPGEDSESLQARHAQALGLCAMCPALDRCTSWLESLPKRQRLLGVVAGRRYTTEGEVPPGSGCDSTAAAVDAVLEQLATLAEDRGDR
jgi:hypothetical protein